MTDGEREHLFDLARSAPTGPAGSAACAEAPADSPWSHASLRTSPSPMRLCTT